MSNPNRTGWRRALTLAIAVISFSAVIAAVLIQSHWNLRPCTMCIIIRYAFLGIGVLALTSLVRGRLLRKVGLIGCGLVAALGVIPVLMVNAAINNPSVTCGRDKVAAFLNGLPWVDWAPQLFEATGVCGDSIPPVMGLAFHSWAFVLFLISLLAVVIVCLGWKIEPASMDEGKVTD